MFKGFIFALLPFLNYNSIHSHYLNAEQHQDQVDLHHALTSSSQIATTAVLLSFPPHEQHIQNNLDDVSAIPIKVHPPPPKTTFKHQSVN